MSRILPRLCEVAPHPTPKSFEKIPFIHSRPDIPGRRSVHATSAYAERTHMHPVHARFDFTPFT